MERGHFNELESVQAFVEHILVVEDDPEWAEKIRRTLEANGFKVTIATDGGQAHASIRMYRPDFVLLKVILPGESGFEICEWIKKEHDSLPVLIFTEIDLESAKNLAERVGADGYLIRPCSDEKLIAMIRKVADVVWKRVNSVQKKETGVIKFKCRFCGQRLREKFENRGKSITCPECNERIFVPQYSLHEFITEDSDQRDGQGTGAKADPLKFVTVKCTHCSTFYRLFSADINKARTCPKCGKRQQGVLSIIGAPLSRAALESCMRVLKIRSGKNKGKKLLLPEREVILGSGEGCHIRNNAKGIAPQHCALLPTVGGIRVRDLGSETGTWINDTRVQGEALLKPGDVLKVGTLQLQLVGPKYTREDLVQAWSAKDHRSSDRGLKVFHETADTATEAARVIKQYWDLVRAREMQQAGSES